MIRYLITTGLLLCLFLPTFAQSDDFVVTTYADLRTGTMQFDTIRGKLRFTNLTSSVREVEFLDTTGRSTYRYTPATAVAWHRGKEIWRSKEVSISGLLDTVFVRENIDHIYLKLYSYIDDGKLLYVIQDEKDNVRLLSEKRFEKDLANILKRNKIIKDHVPIEEDMNYQDIEKLVTHANLMDDSINPERNKPTVIGYARPPARPKSEERREWVNDVLYLNFEYHIGPTLTFGNYFKENVPAGGYFDYGVDYGLFQNYVSIGAKGSLSYFPKINQGSIFRSEIGMFMHIQKPNTVRVFGGVSINAMNYNVNPEDLEDPPCSNLQLHNGDRQYQRKLGKYNLMTGRGYSYSIGASFTLAGRDLCIEYSVFPVNYTLNQFNWDYVTGAGRELTPVPGDLTMRFVTLKTGFRAGEE